MRPHRSNLAACTAAICLLCLLLHLDALAAQESTLPGPTVPDGFGVNIHFTKFQPGELSDFKNAGFGLIRMDLGWGEIERSTGVYDFSAFDTLLSELDSAGARALLIFDYSNPLYDQGLSPYTPSGRAAFARYAAAAASHFRGRHVIWEIYNEPNGGFWTPQVNVDNYAALVKSTATAVRRADPNAVILAGATSGLPAAYIQTLLRSGALADVNALSVHPYRDNNPETAAEDYNRIRILIARATPQGQKPLPIVCSEWGYSTVTGGGFSEQKQAAYMVREYLSNLACGVNLTIYYDWKNDGPDPANNEHRFGIQTEDLKPKPAYIAAQSLITALRGYTFRHRLAASEAADYRLLFQGTNDLALVTWSSKDNSESPSLPTVQKIGRADQRYNDLLRIASIRYAPDTLVATNSPRVPLSLAVTNPTSNRASLVIATNSERKKVMLGPKQTTALQINRTLDQDNKGDQNISPKITWNGQPLSGIYPLTGIAASIFDIAISPYGPDLEVKVTNGLSTSFDGAIRLTSDNGKSTAEHIALAAGQGKTTIFIDAANSGGHIIVTTKSGVIMARVSTGRFLPMAAWPTELSQPSEFNNVFYLDNKPDSSAIASVTKTDQGAPASVAVSFSYQSGSQWRYYTLAPTKPIIIPIGAKALSLWVRGDKSGVTIRARFSDQTGQTFQPDGVAITWNGWQAVEFPLDGQNASHWGGANDGMPHGTLQWSAIPLLDCGGMADHTGTIELAAPAYAMP